MEIEFLTNERRKSRDEILSDRGMSRYPLIPVLSTPEVCVTEPSVEMLSIE